MAASVDEAKEIIKQPPPHIAAVKQKSIRILPNFFSLPFKNRKTKTIKFETNTKIDDIENIFIYTISTVSVVSVVSVVSTV